MSLEDIADQVKFNDLSHQEQHKIEQNSDRKLIPPEMNCLYLDWGRRYYDLDGLAVATIQTKPVDL